MPSSATADDPHYPVRFLRGRTLGISRPRRFVGDLLAFAQRVPSVPMQRRMHLSDVVEARQASRERVSWCAIFLKAYAIVSANRPELRRSYISFPWPTIYEHPENVATFSVEREHEGEQAVFFAQVPQPELLPLRELDTYVRRHKTAPIESIETFRRALLLSSLPRPLRRFIWWLGLCTDGMYRARFFGTFGISVVAAFGAAGLHILSPLTTTLNYGAFEPDGSIDVRLAYDHRVLDGATVARAMAALEDVLQGEIADELRATALAETRSTPRPLETAWAAS